MKWLSLISYTWRKFLKCEKSAELFFSTIKSNSENCIGCSFFLQDFEHFGFLTLSSWAYDHHMRCNKNLQSMKALEFDFMVWNLVLSISRINTVLSSGLGAAV